MDTQQAVKTENKAEKMKDSQYYFRGFLFVVLLMVASFVIVLMYWWLHGISIVTMFTQNIQVWPATFVGGTNTPFSVGVEIWAWSLLGVNCRTAYIVGQAVLEQEFVFGKSLVYWVSTCLFGWGISVAVIFSLQAIELTVAGFQITLANAPIQTIVAISFVLGFYNDNAHKLLESLKEQIVRGGK